MTRSTDRNRGIKVLQKHIDEGERESSNGCMGVLAIKDAIPGSKKVHVDLQTCRYTDSKDVRRTFLTPSPLQAALVRYDAGDEVKPFTFSLNSLLHISRAKKSRVQGPTIKVDDNIRENRSDGARARHGGRPVPVLRNSTRRRFGIRNLRINQEGKVVQSGVDE